MTDLSYEDVATIARVAGLRLAADDLVDVTHHLNLLISGLEQFDTLDLQTCDPVPFFPLDERVHEL